MGGETVRDRNTERRRQKETEVAKDRDRKKDRDGDKDGGEQTMEKLGCSSRLRLGQSCRKKVNYSISRDMCVSVCGSEFPCMCVLVRAREQENRKTEMKEQERDGKQ